MEKDLSNIHAELERQMIRDTMKLSREEMACCRSDWRMGLVKLDAAIGNFVAWYVTKLLGWKKAFIEPEVIEELSREEETEDVTNGRLP